MTTAADTYELLGAFVDELARCGLRDACTSPGSRCAPLLLTLARERRLRCHSHIDERCAGFFALGLAKASGLPVALTCTSGTAVAELLPAVVEAHEARVPLIVLSADRPPELRDSGAGQTIDQLKIFGGFAKWFFEVGNHAADAERMRWMRTLACRAWWTALEGRPGVVHLNFPLREPLVCEEFPRAPGEGRAEGRPYLSRPTQDEPNLSSTQDESNLSSPTQDESNLSSSTQDERNLSSPTQGQGTDPQADLAPNAAPDSSVDTLLELVRLRRRGVLVAGRHERRTQLGRAAAGFCELVGWPLLADPMSGARRGDAAVAHYDALLRDPRFAREHKPDFVLRVGDLPVSKPLRTWLAGLTDTLQVALDPEGAWQDPASVLWASLAVEPAAALSALTGRLEGSTVTGSDWLASWHSADELAAEAILGVLGARGCSEPWVAAELGMLLPKQATLFVASSMPIRDIETFWPVRPDPPRVLCNRGANGIDGIVSSAFGAAAACDGPVLLLIGDVALAHDIGGLLAAKRLDLKLTIVLLDNGGGGIFDFLPIADSATALGEDDLYIRHIATPPELDFAQAAALYGLSHEAVADTATFRTALERALASPKSAIVEVHGERAANVDLHRDVWRAVAGVA
jgi:2-succinyl-5-enolpyruvyl-6-hydroxy-3-cyclohexene-1-carboxylate synthase